MLRGRVRRYPGREPSVRERRCNRQVRTMEPGNSDCLRRGRRRDRPARSGKSCHVAVARYRALGFLRDRRAISRWAPHSTLNNAPSRPEQTALPLYRTWRGPGKFASLDNRDLLQPRPAASVEQPLRIRANNYAATAANVGHLIKSFSVLNAPTASRVGPRRKFWASQSTSGV